MDTTHTHTIENDPHIGDDVVIYIISENVYRWGNAGQGENACDCIPFVTSLCER